MTLTNTVAQIKAIKEYADSTPATREAAVAKAARFAQLAFNLGLVSKDDIDLVTLTQALKEDSVEEMEGLR